MGIIPNIPPAKVFTLSKYLGYLLLQKIISGIFQTLRVTDLVNNPVPNQEWRKLYIDALLIVDIPDRSGWKENCFNYTIFEKKTFRDLESSRDSDAYLYCFRRVEKNCRNWSKPELKDACSLGFR